MDEMSVVRASSVSVVVPVLDVADRVGACLEALLAQSYPRQRTQIIVVDNGSRDGTREMAGRYPVTLLVEDSATSPYAARNRGLAVADGDVVAFTDGTCVPAADWIEEGVRALEEGNADLAGGEARFAMSEPPTLAELADAIMDLDVQASIRTHRACMTCNLFVRRTVLEAIGPFDPLLRSGGDMRWTRRATDAGFKIVFAPAAVVSLPARRLGPLLHKQYRVGRGVPGVWASFGMTRPQVLGATTRGLLPMPPHRLPRRARERVGQIGPGSLAGVWWVIWMAKIARVAGCVRGLAGG